MRQSRTLTTCGVLLAGLIVGACSLLYDLSADQCKTSGDCAAKGEAFADTECVKGMCVPVNSVQTECTVNADCSLEIEGQWSICKSGTCLSLADGSNGECRLVLGTGEDDSRYLHRASPAPIVIGGFANATVNPYGNQAVPNYELALLEHNRVAARKVVMVVCNSLTDDLGPSIDHLVGTLDVPAIVAAVLDNHLEMMLDDLTTRGKKVFIMNALEADRSIEDARLDSDELVWHILGAPTGLAPIYQPLLDRIAQASAGARAGSPFADEALRVAIVEASPDLTELSGAVRSSVAIGGKSLTSLINDGEAQLQRISATNGAPAAEQADIVERILDFGPHVVISMATREFVPLMEALEASWPEFAPEDLPRPYYILSQFQYNDERIPELTGNPLYGLSARVVGVNHAPANEDAKTLYDIYYSNLRAEFGTEAGQVDLAGTENFYDATWYTLYAIAATENPTGPRIADGMKRLLDGYNQLSIIQAGPTSNGISDVLSALSSSDGQIRLNGTMGPPDFDSFGVKETVPSVYCIGTSDEGDIGFLENAYSYDQASNSLVEHIPCRADL